MHPGTHFLTNFRNSRERKLGSPASFAATSHTAPQQPRPSRPLSWPSPNSEGNVDTMDGHQQEEPKNDGPPSSSGLAAASPLQEGKDAMDDSSEPTQPQSSQSQSQAPQDADVQQQPHLAGTKKKRKRKPPDVPWKKPPDMPRRPLSAYNLFFRERREAMMLVPSVASAETAATSDDVRSSPQGSHQAPKVPRKKKSGKSVGIGFANLARTIASEWKELDAQSKVPYEEIASAEKDRYDREMVIWRAKQKEEKASGVATSPTPSTGNTAGTGSVGRAKSDSHILDSELFQDEAIHRSASMVVSSSSPTPSSRRMDQDVVGGAMMHPNSLTQPLSSNHPFAGALAATSSSHLHPDMGSMMMMDHAMHQQHQHQLQLEQQQYDHSMMMHEQQQQQLSHFGIPHGLSAMQMSELSSAAFRNLSQQDSRAFLHEQQQQQQQQQQQVPAHGQGIIHGSGFADQQQSFWHGNMDVNDSFNRSMDAFNRNRRSRMASMIGTIDEQFQQHSSSVPFNLGIGHGGGYAGDSAYSYSSPELDYHHPSTLMEGQEDVGNQRMDHLLYAARRNTWSGLSQAQQHAFQQQLAMQERQQQHQYQDQQLQFQQRRITLGGGMPFGAVGTPDRPMDFLRQQQLFQQGQQHATTTTVPDSWMELSPESTGSPSRSMLQTSPAERETGSLHQGQDGPTARGPGASSEGMSTTRNVGGTGTLYPDTWFEADANMADANEAAGVHDDNEPLRYSPDGELNEKLPGKTTTNPAASHGRSMGPRSTSSSSSSSGLQKEGSNPSGKRGTKFVSPMSQRDPWKPIGIREKGRTQSDSMEDPVKRGETDGDPLEYSEELGSVPPGANDGGSSSDVNYDQDGQRMNPSSLQALGMRLDDETVDFLTKLRFSNLTNTSDHSSSPPTDS